MKSGQRRAGGMWGIGALFLAIPALANVILPDLLGSHMVLQRDRPVPVWGTAAPGETVTVRFRDREKRAVADSRGLWRIDLEAMPAGGPDTMTVAGTNTITLDDVLVGEVWLGSGQSNMAQPVSSYLRNDTALSNAAAGTYPGLRLYRHGYPGWRVAVPTNNVRMSAHLFAFGLPLHRALDVPVGLMVAAVGGTPSGFWLSESAYTNDAACREVIAAYAKTYSLEAAKARVREETVKYDAAMAAWEKLTPEERKHKDRPRPPVPALLPGECNGPVGKHYETMIRPFIPYAIRGVLWDQGEARTAIEGIDQYTLMGALIRGWRRDWGQGEFPFIYVQKPSGGGCAWDPSDPVTAKADPFAPLPGYVPNDGDNRENHIRIMRYPNTAMVTTSDLGRGVHPQNKSGYGARSCRVALGFVYGRKVEIYGPVYQSHTVEGHTIRIRFDHVGQGLACPANGKLQGFAVAGEDMRFVWADATIDGAAVVVSAARVAKPVAVRYAWSRMHPWANLFNRDGLPALPFRTDHTP